MDLRDLRYFVVIAECGSILAASEQLHMAQPSLSIRIKALEQELGVMLFERRPRGVALTSEGQELLGHARQILHAAEAARESVRLHAKTAVGTVNFGVPTSLAAVLCVPLVERSLEELPDVRLRIVESMSGYILDWLREGRLDVGLVFADKSVGGVTLEPILEEELYLAAASEEALAPLMDQNGEVRLEHLAGLRLILPTGHHGLRQLVDEMTRRNGVPRMARIEIDSFSQIQQLVHRGLGMTILSLAALHGTRLDPPLATARLCSPPIKRCVSLAFSESRSLTKATREIANRTRAILRQEAKKSPWRPRLL